MASRTAYSTWTPQKPTLFDGHYLRNRSNLDICVLGYIGIVQHKEHSPEVLSIPPGTPCIPNVLVLHLNFYLAFVLMNRAMYILRTYQSIIYSFTTSKEERDLDSSMASAYNDRNV